MTSIHLCIYVRSSLVIPYVFCLYFVFFFKQKTAYEMRISDWSSDVCSSDLLVIGAAQSMAAERGGQARGKDAKSPLCRPRLPMLAPTRSWKPNPPSIRIMSPATTSRGWIWLPGRSEEHTSELQSLMRISYAVFCLNEKQPTSRTYEYIP